MIQKLKKKTSGVLHDCFKLNGVEIPRHNPPLRYLMYSQGEPEMIKESHSRPPQDNFSSWIITKNGVSLRKTIHIMY